MASEIEINQLCRLCLVKEQVNVPIFEEEGDLGQIFLKISACLPVKISRDDSLPKKICDSCSCKLDVVYQFWNTSANSEKQLLKWLNQLGVVNTMTSANKKNSDSQMAHSINAETVINLKQEVVELAEHEDDDNMTTEEMDDSNDSENYMLQQQHIPYENFSFQDGFPNEEPSHAVASSTVTSKTVNTRPKRKRRATTKALQSQLDSDDEDDSLLRGKITKTEEQSDSGEDPEPTAFVGLPSTSTDDQPGPSGINKGNSEAPFCLEDNSILKRLIIGPSMTVTVQPPSILIRSNKDCETEKFKYDIDDYNNLLEIHGTRSKKSVLRARKNIDYASGLIKEEENHVIDTNRVIQKRKIKKECDDKPIINKGAAEGIDKSNIINDVSRTDVLAHKRALAAKERKRKELEEKRVGMEAKVKRQSKKKAHKLKESQINERVHCDICDKTFKNSLSFALHSIKHNGDEKYSCHVCSYTNTSKYNFEMHMRAHEGFSKYKCEICNKGFSISTHAIEHKNFHTGEKPYQCEICGKHFMFSWFLSSHRRTQHFEIMTGMPLVKYDCVVCNKHYTSATGLRRHNLSQHNDSSIDMSVLCDVCGKRLSSKEKLKFHRRIHTGYKPHACNTCPKSFSRKEQLKEHERVHTGEKPYICNYCAKGFTQRSPLKIHERTHTGERPYICRLCSKGFISKGVMDTHLKNCDGGGGSVVL